MLDNVAVVHGVYQGFPLVPGMLVGAQHVVERIVPETACLRKKNILLITSLDEVIMLIGLQSVQQKQP
jgi:hypothetical protein